MQRMTIRDGAGEYSLTIETETGVQRWDLSKLNRNQIAGVRELVVNAWSRAHGFSEVYPNV